MAMAIAMVYVERRMAIGIGDFSKIFGFVSIFNAHSNFVCGQHCCCCYCCCFVVVVGNRVVVKRCAKVWK